VNLVFEAGKHYLVLGAPGSGKSTLLKMISQTLYKSRNHKFEGEVSIGSLHPEDKGVYWSKLVSYIDQIDRLHAFLTVRETCEFAWQCRSGGTHRREFYPSDQEDVDELVAELDEERYVINAVLDMLGLSRVKDTFVGDKEKVRGVSGGEKKRVTVAEMFVLGVPVACCDEISTGLDGT
jgi:ABC-type multidrug transport system ATPase subunit